MEKAANPIPQGHYAPATRAGNTIYTAGMTPRLNGVMIKSGRLTVDADLEEYHEAAVQAAKNALTAARNQLKDGEKIVRILSFTFYINADKGFTRQAKFADFASDYFCEELGESGVAARAAIGVESLPGNAPCEAQIIAYCE